MAERIRTWFTNGKCGVQHGAPRPLRLNSVVVLQVHHSVQTALHRSSSKSSVSNLTSKTLVLAQDSGVTSTPDGCFFYPGTNFPPQPSPQPGLERGREERCTAQSDNTNTLTRQKKTKASKWKFQEHQGTRNKSELILVRFSEELQYSININDASMQV